MIYAGIDVHRKRSQVSLVDGDGKELLNRNVDNGSEAMLDILEDLEPGTPVAFEAAYGWGWLADLLEEHELEGHLVHPSACKAIASARLKNDKVDARMLAHLLRTDLLPEALRSCFAGGPHLDRGEERTLPWCTNPRILFGSA